MNESNRKGANALVAVVDFFVAALAAEAQAGEEKQRHLDHLAGQLKLMTTAESRESEALSAANLKVVQLTARVAELEDRQRRLLEKRKVDKLISASVELQRDASAKGRVDIRDARFEAFEKALDSVTGG